jgi:hypothetical protein
VSRKGKERTGIDMPASVEYDAEVVAAEIDVCAVYYVTTVFDRDAGDIVAFGEVARIWAETANGKSDGKGKLQGGEKDEP